MHSIWITIAFMALGIATATAQDVSSFIVDGPGGQAAGGSVSHVEHGYSDTRIAPEMRYLRNTTIGRDANGGLLVAVSYALRDGDNRTLAAHNSQFAIGEAARRNYLELNVEGNYRSVQLQGEMHSSWGGAALLKGFGSSHRGSVLTKGGSFRD